MSKQFYFTQFSLANANHRLVLFNPEIGPLSGATTPVFSGPGSDGNKGVLRIPQSSSITGTSYTGHLLYYLANYKVSISHQLQTNHS